MPMKWVRGRKSPYACNHFAVLRVGPNSSRQEINQTGDNTLRAIKGGAKVTCACGHDVDVHQVGHATSHLLEPDALAEELLLIHPQPPRDNKAKLKALAENLHKAAALPLVRTPIPLRDPAAILWFTPAPGPEVIELPTWKDLGLSEAGGVDDLALDIVFDS